MLTPADYFRVAFEYARRRRRWRRRVIVEEPGAQVGPRARSLISPLVPGPLLSIIQAKYSEAPSPAGTEAAGGGRPGRGGGEGPPQSVVVEFVDPDPAAGGEARLDSGDGPSLNPPRGSTDPSPDVEPDRDRDTGLPPIVLPPVILPTTTDGDADPGSPDVPGDGGGPPAPVLPVLPAAPITALNQPQPSPTDFKGYIETLNAKLARSGSIRRVPIDPPWIVRSGTWNTSAGWTVTALGGWYPNAFIELTDFVRYSNVQFELEASGPEIAIMVRFSRVGGLTNGYMVYLTPAGTSVQLYRVQAGVANLLGTHVGTWGATVGLRAMGPQLDLLFDGVSVMTRTDANIAEGTLGIGGFAIGSRFDAYSIQDW